MTKAEDDIFKRNKNISGKHRVDFPEFLKLIETRLQDKHTTEDLNECFSIFDKDMDGKVSAGEVRHALLTLGRYV
jgi:calmodulin